MRSSSRAVLVATVVAAAFCCAFPARVHAQSNNATTITYDGDTMIFDADISVTGYSHKLMQAVDTLVNANYGASIDNVINIVNNMQTQIAHVSPYNSPLAYNCTVGAACPCYPVSPCDQGKVCTAQGTTAYTCGTPNSWLPSVPYFGTQNLTNFHNSRSFDPDDPRLNIGYATERIYGKFAHLNFDGTALFITSQHGPDANAAADGAVFYFTRNSSVSDDWTLVQTLLHPTGDSGAHYGHGFGASEDMSVLAIKMNPYIALYSRNSTGHFELFEQLLPDGNSVDEWSIELSADGNVVAVGMQDKQVGSDSDAGWVHIYQRQSRDLPYMLQQEIYDPIPQGRDSVHFGHEVHLNEDASTLMVRTGDVTGTARMHVYTRINSDVDFELGQTIEPETQVGLPAQQVLASDMTPSGSAVVMGSEFDGAHWVYVRHANGTYLLAHHEELPDIGYGVDVAINFEHLVLVNAQWYDIPCTDAGVTYFYSRSNETTWFLQQRVQVEQPSTCTTGIAWGQKLHASADFRTIMVSSPLADVFGTNNGINMLLERRV